MDIFVEKFQPERYEAWLQGKDQSVHPEGEEDLAQVEFPSRDAHKEISAFSKKRRHPIHKKNDSESDSENIVPGDEIVVDQTHEDQVFPGQYAMGYLEDVWEKAGSMKTPMMSVLSVLRKEQKNN